MIKAIEKYKQQVITIRSITGEEYVAKLMDIDTDNNMLILANPRVVVINDDQVVLVPFVLTASSNKVSVTLNNVFSIIPTLEQTAKEYTTLVTQEYIKEMGETAVKVDAEPVTDKY